MDIGKAELVCKKWLDEAKAEITKLSKELQAYKEVLRGAEAVLRQCLYGYSELLGCKTCSLCDSADDSVNDSIDSVTALLSKIDSMNRGE